VVLRDQTGDRFRAGNLTEHANGDVDVLAHRGHLLVVERAVFEQNGVRDPSLPDIVHQGR
jgi:hypothetical protein